MFSLGWFRTFKPDRPLLPPLLQLRFPLNVVRFSREDRRTEKTKQNMILQMLILLLPILIPSFLSFTVVRLSWSSYRSRARIKVLEKDASHQQSLMYSLAKLEKNVEDAVADMMDDPGPDPDSDSDPDTAGTQQQQQQQRERKRDAGDDDHAPPILSPTQLRIAACLNTLPHLKKERAWIGQVRNSHAPIVCRDVRFAAHRVGEGLIRHWADHFVL